MDDRPALARYDGDLAGAGLAVAETVASLMVDVEGMMRMLDGRDPITAQGELAHQFLDQCGLAGILEAGDADDLLRHGWISARMRKAASLSAGLLILKKGSYGSLGHWTMPASWSATHCLIERRPFSICCSSSWASAAFHRPKTGCRRPADEAQASSLS